MAATKTRSTPSPDESAASRTAGKAAKDVGGSVATAAGKAKRPVLTAGATAAALAGGFMLGSRMTPKRRGLGALFAPQRKVLGVPVGRKNGAVRTAKALGKAARELSSAGNQLSGTSDDIRQLREQLDQANRRSPIEVVLDGLTHRRGAHKNES